MKGFELIINIWEIVREMAWQGTLVILLVMLCRLFVGRVSKRASYFLWLVVVVRLLCPVLLPSQFSIFNFLEIKEEVKVEDTIDDRVLSEYTEVTHEYTAPALPIQGEAMEEDPVFPQQGSQTIISNREQEENGQTVMITKVYTKDSLFMACIWLAGCISMCAYGIFSYWKMKKMLRFATKIEDEIFESERITSPFVFGILKPIIYLPLHLTEMEKTYVLAHETYHLKRRDYLIKPVAYGLLSIYWFQPFVWAAFYCMSKDMEMSCDEQVIKNFKSDARKAYSTLLLNFASDKHFPIPSPLSFGESNTKSRIKQVLNYKSPTLWGIIAAVILIFIIAVCCLTDAKKENDGNALTENSNAATEVTDNDIFQLAKSLYEIKNPYIGDVSANGEILQLLREHYGISGTSGTELQTYNEPYWINIDFEKKPDDKKMWQLSAMFLALVENAGEVRWTFTNADGKLETYYVEADSLNTHLEKKSVKEYAVSAESLAELYMELNKISEKTSWQEEIERSVYIKDSAWTYYTQREGLTFEERTKWENRMIADGIPYRGEKGKLNACRYEDFDKNGCMDLVVAIQDKNWDNAVETLFCIYMNEEPVYIRELEIFGVFWNIQTADIDNDGLAEFIFAGDTGGTGGYGFNAIFDILKYQNGTFEVIPLPKDSFLEASDEDAGFGIEVYATAEKDIYEAYSPLLNKNYKFSFSGEDTKDNGKVGTLIGRERYGFSKLTPVEQNLKTYLLGEETLYRPNQMHYHSMEDIGTAYFLMNWDAANGWIVEDFYVAPIINDVTSNEHIFSAMKARLKNYPTDMEELHKIWANIPVIDSVTGTIYGNVDRFTEYAKASEDAIEGSFIYAKRNERDELTYVCVEYRNNTYYYIEDYTRLSEKPTAVYGEDYLQKTYSSELYTTVEYEENEVYEHFYLTNEENLTQEAVMKSMLSSQYPPELDFVSVYTRKLTVEEVRTNRILNRGTNN